MLHRFGLLVGNDLRRRLRNRSAIISAVVAPLALAVVFSMLVGGPRDDDAFTIGVATEERSDLTDSVTSSLVDADADMVRFVAVESPAVAERRVDDGALDAALVLPAGFGAEIEGPIVVLRSPDRQVSASIAESVAAALAQRAERTKQIVAVLARLGASLDDTTIARASAVESAARVVEDSERGELTAAGYFGASMSVIFLFFTVGFAATSLHVERRSGTLARLLATPTSPGTVLVAKTTSVALIGLSGFVVVWLVTTLGFGARWGPPLGVFAVIAATTFAITGVATFAASLARTEQQTEAATSAIGFLFAILGGNFIGPGQAPEALARLEVLTPNGWALRLFVDLATDASTGAGLAQGVAALCAFGLVGMVAGLARMRWLVSA